MIITEDSCFKPDGFVYADPLGMGYRREDLWLEGRIAGWVVLPGVEPRATIVHLHGSRHNMSAHFLKCSFLLEQGYKLVLFDYSGFGRSGGQPSLANVKRDSLAVFSHVFGNQALFGDNVFGFGQNLGGWALASILPRISRLSGAIIEGAPTSYHDLYAERYRGTHNTIPQDGFSTLDALPRSGVPKLFIHGMLDEKVPHEHSERQFAVAAEPKELLLLDEGGHLNVLETYSEHEYKLGIERFLQRYIL